MEMLQAKLNSFLDNLRSPEDFLIFADFLEEAGLSAEADLVRCQKRLRDNPEDSQARSLEEQLLARGVRPPVFVNNLGMKFARVPAGTFWMGGGQRRARQVDITQDFYLGVYPVTQEQWQRLMGNNPSYFCRTGGGRDRVKDISDADLKQFPVEQVSWNDAREFLLRLNAWQNHRDWVYRLPTEAEWEYACRGGATSKSDCSFHFYFDQPTNDLSLDQANFGSGGPGVSRTTKVGSYLPNRLGIYDLHGNVWEWCQDIFKGFWRVVLGEGSWRVVRGGSWGGAASPCGQAGHRDNGNPTARTIIQGFRVARVPPGS